MTIEHILFYEDHVIELKAPEKPSMLTLTFFPTISSGKN